MAISTHALRIAPGGLVSPVQLLTVAIYIRKPAMLARRTVAFEATALLCAALATEANQLANFPFNFLRTGYYGYSDGKIYARTTHGDWWSATRSSATNANRLYTNIANINSQFSDARGHGFALRCGATSNSVTSSTYE